MKKQTHTLWIMLLFGIIYFNANAQQPEILEDINTTPRDGSNKNLTVIGDKVYFAATNYNHAGIDQVLGRSKRIRQQSLSAHERMVSYK